MAVPASGTIKFSGIYSELINDDYNQDLDQAAARPASLKDMSDGTVSTINTLGNKAPNRPDGSAPHTMSEFYSYDHDA
jgi:hypothetical protein